MDRVRVAKTRLRFGAFEIDFEAGELRRRGVLIGLQEQPFRLLCALLERPGEVITREELRGQIWPADTFVDFDGSLNIAVLKVRQALGDSASQPRFIETVPRRGYRFVASVEAATAAVAGRETAAASGEAPGAETLAGNPQRPTSSEHRRRFTRPALAAGLASALGMSVLYVASRGSRPAPGPVVAVPLTAFPGFEANPALSADGTRVAFSWDGDKQRNFDIYVSGVPAGSAAPFRLTTAAADDLSPAWSPDGQKIAFLRRTAEDRGELLVVAATGGPEHKVADVWSRELALMRVNSLSWSPNGRWISTAHREASDPSSGIYAFSLTGNRRRLTMPPKEYHGDHMPAFSPDGRALAFCRLAGFSTSEIYVVSLDGELAPIGAPRSITTYKRWSVNPVWIEEGRRVLHLLSEHPETRHELRVASVTELPAHPRTVMLPDEPAEISATTKGLIYSRRVADSNIWRVRIPAEGEPPAVPERFITSTRSDEKPSYSPDGTRIAFVSKRSGSDEIWIANADGGNAVRMTSFGGALVGIMNWSPDGQRIVFHARPEGQADLFVIAAAGGAPVQLTHDRADDTMPSYSHDGRWIFFGSQRSGEYAIWKMAAAGGAATQLTVSRGARPVESLDGKVVYFHQWPEPDGIWSVPVTGGEPVKITGPTHPFPLALAVTADGIYYGAPPHAGEKRFIRFFRFSTRRSYPVAVTDRPFRLGMSVSPDERFLVFDQLDESGSDLMLVRDFAAR
jgi:Tol biopolymer transport system component/DNA-binding winged helix-turn-helix (wHTH) protein